MCSTGMKPTDRDECEEAAAARRWTKTYTGTKGKSARVFTTTMGHCGDLKSENFRRLLGQCLLLVSWAGGQDSGESQRRFRRQVRAELDPRRRGQEGMSGRAIIG